MTTSVQITFLVCATLIIISIIGKIGGKRK